MTPLSQVWMRGDAPGGFRWRRRRIEIKRVIEGWREAGKWWRGDPEIAVWRVEGSDHGVYELAFDSEGKRWWLARIYD